MLTVKASVKPSQIEGIGLFADELIPKGTMTWKFDPQFDLLFDSEAVEKMSPSKKEFIQRYAYLSKTSNKYVFSVDDSRFTNHATNSNIDSVAVEGEPERCGIANKDIQIGEELTVNYRLFDSHDESSSEEYLLK